MDTFSVYKIDLYCGSSNHNKVYNITINENAHSGKCTVDVEYGRRGSNLKQTTKTAKPVIKRDAERITKELLIAKQSKGYRVVQEIHGPPLEIKTKRLKFRLEKLYINNTIELNHYSKLSGMIQSNDLETITLAENIIYQKLQMPTVA
jgi:predicted DNA-binding WGR domain protein